MLFPENLVMGHLPLPSPHNNRKLWIAPLKISEKSQEHKCDETIILQLLVFKLLLYLTGLIPDVFKF